MCERERERDIIPISDTGRGGRTMTTNLPDPLLPVSLLFHKERERKRDTFRQTDMAREREIKTESDRQREGEREIGRDRQTQRNTNYI